MCHACGGTSSLKSGQMSQTSAFVLSSAVLWCPGIYHMFVHLFMPHSERLLWPGLLKWRSALYCVVLKRGMKTSFFSLSCRPQPWMKRRVFISKRYSMCVVLNPLLFLDNDFWQQQLQQSQASAGSRTILKIGKSTQWKSSGWKKKKISSEWSLVLCDWKCWHNALKKVCMQGEDWMCTEMTSMENKLLTWWRVLFALCYLIPYGRGK